jgi:hypothetical protein
MTAPEILDAVRQEIAEVGGTLSALSRRLAALRDVERILAALEKAEADGAPSQGDGRRGEPRRPGHRPRAPVALRRSHAARVPAEARLPLQGERLELIEGPRALGMGKAFQKAIELQDPDAGVTALRDATPAGYDQARAIDKLRIEEATVRAAAALYLRRWPAPVDGAETREFEYRVRLRNPWTGPLLADVRPARLRRRRDRRGAYLELIENKFVGQIDAAHDPQAEARPPGRPRVLRAVARDREAGPRRPLPLRRKPSIKPWKATKNKPAETTDEFIERLTADYEKRPTSTRTPRTSSATRPTCCGSSRSCGCGPTSSAPRAGATCSRATRATARTTAAASSSPCASATPTHARCTGCARTTTTTTTTRRPKPHDPHRQGAHRLRDRRRSSRREDPEAATSGSSPAPLSTTRTTSRARRSKST